MSRSKKRFTIQDDNLNVNHKLHDKANSVVLKGWLIKDTVSKQSEHYKVYGRPHARLHTSLRANAVVHHLVPVLSSQDLRKHTHNDTQTHTMSSRELSWKTAGDLSYKLKITFHHVQSHTLWFTVINVCDVCVWSTEQTWKTVMIAAGKVSKFVGV